MFFRSMAARGHALKLPTLISVARCDGDKPTGEEGVDDGGGDGGFGGLDGEEKPAGPRFRPPMAFENLMGTLRQGSVNNYDGFRVIVQKQVNMNTVASHFYWIGSQSAPPIYQYRLILPFDDKVVNVATDMDFNVEGEVRCPLLPNVGAKVSFSVHEQQGNNLTFDIDMADESSATQLQYTSANTLSLSFMQSMSKSIILGGLAEYIGNKSLVNLSFGGVYDDGDNVIAAQWDKNFRAMYMKRVNHNRVHLSADLVVDEQSASIMSVGAEYMLKQSKLHMSIDSNMLIKSYLETNLGPGITMQFCAEMQQHKEHFKFGYGIQMMG